MIQRIVANILLLSLLAACRVGPSHSIPVIPVYDQWQAAPRTAEGLDLTPDGDLLRMWELFHDPLLNDLLRSIVHTNLDLQLAHAKICEAYALRRISVASLFPFVNARIDQHQMKPAGGILTTGQNTGGGAPLDGIPLNLKEQNFLANFDASWELDVFGRRQNEIKAATAFLQMQEANRNSVYIALLAECGKTYLELRTAQEIASLLERQIALMEAIQEESAERFQNGLTDAQTVLQIEVSLADLKAGLPIQEAAIQTAAFRLSTLAGMTPEAFLDRLMPRAPLPDMAALIPIGVPSDLLLRRPDVRYVERQAAEANAELGVAIADLYPRIVIDGSYGFQDLHLGQTKGKGESWSFGGGLLTPVFHGGKLRANADRYRWIHRETILEYEQTVLQALEEAEGAMARLAASKKALEDRKTAFEKSKDLFNHINNLFKNGLAAKMNLLETESNMLEAKKAWISQKGDAGIRLIALYKALGGGW